MEPRDTKRWSNFENYDRYVGSWSELVAAQFLEWLEPEPNQTWLDIGCGTGRLAAMIAGFEAPRELMAIDLSPQFVEAARKRLPEFAATITTADAMDLPIEDDQCDYTVSGLVLNFLPDAQSALSEWSRVTKPGGTVAAYVWDYLEDMEPFEKLWQAATTVDDSARSHQLYSAYAICNPGPLQELFEHTGLQNVATTGISIPVKFASIDDYWSWISGGQGSGPSYVMSLDPDQQQLVRQALASIATPRSDGSITLTAKAWAVKGSVPESA